MEDTPNYRAVLRESDETIVVRFPDPDKVDLPLEPGVEEMLPDEYIEKGYYPDVDEVASQLDVDILNLFGHLCRAVVDLDEHQDSSELESLLERLCDHHFDFDSITVEVE